MNQSILDLQQQASLDIESATHPRDIENIRIAYFGKKGRRYKIIIFTK